MLASPAIGYDTLPPEAPWMPMRFSAPLTQRSPSPKTIPSPAAPGPCRKTVEEVGNSPLDWSATESAANDALPEESSRAPPVACEFRSEEHTSELQSQFH